MIISKIPLNSDSSLNIKSNHDDVWPMVVVQQLCGLAEVSWLDGDDGNVELWELLAENGRRALDGVLGSTVDGEAGVAVETGNTADIDDTAWKKW